ncbi:glycogen synthase GlgA [Methylotuvimicrobium alcaliphilum]|uniref:Glycogen synthase n=1 Tax=Methylotuvimicrobium alcaliphilum (strain DSM 19304 / NCIMB 14124 / VKM B-2133 / 20Z) TaxID=1091494 RepID=G4SVS8_META2|nr:glycogen synthase GlgA [Methylotuvimicrobium alcaliphilum]CCE25163.1 Glycogen synthase 2 (modular protein) [Methylotuvimicrobium alcaliphilum 20Z]
MAKQTTTKTRSSTKTATTNKASEKPTTENQSAVTPEAEEQPSAAASTVNNDPKAESSKMEKSTQTDDAPKPSLSSESETAAKPKTVPKAKTAPEVKSSPKAQAAKPAQAEPVKKASSKTANTAKSPVKPKAKAAPKKKLAEKTKTASSVKAPTQTKKDEEKAKAEIEAKDSPKTKSAGELKSALMRNSASKISDTQTKSDRQIKTSEKTAQEKSEAESLSPVPVLPVVPQNETAAAENVASKVAAAPSQASEKAVPKQSGTAGETQVDTSSKGGESVYREPNTAFITPLPEVAQAASISPDVPSEKFQRQPYYSKAEPIAPTPESSAPEPVADMMSHVEHSPYHDQPGPDYPHMFVVQITPELAPLAKVGGLADVVTGLSRELELRGHSVEIILPKYDCMHYDHIWGLCKTYDDLWVPWYNGHIHCTVWFGFVHGRKCFFIEPHSPDNFFNRGTIYGFNDDVLRYAFFCRAALEFLWKSGKHPDVIHCHDWQTALVPVFLYEIYQKLGFWHPRVCFTIHNFKHQGLTGDFLLNATGLHRPEYYFHDDRLLDNRIPHALNLMKGGIVYSNFVTTVSPRYAGETKDGGQGFGLEPTLHAHHYKFGGVVNGIDYDVWNPEIDPHIAAPFIVEKVDNKYLNKRALRDRLLLADNEKPIIAFVGRLDPQKGLDLVRHALFYSLNHRAQFVLLGSSPERDINSYFWELKRHLNDSPDCHIEVGFDEGLAHLIYAGADMIVVPSLFEPCGLTQLISMKYGTVPIVREVGGLADTVFDKDHAHHKALHERNGYVFRDYNNEGLESALSRAIDCYYQFPDHFRELMKNAMRYDYSWKYPGQHYLNIYDYIRNK